MELVACSDFVKRQTKRSEFTHFEGTWEEIEEMVKKILEDHKTAAKYIETGKIRKGYREGVRYKRGNYP